MQWLQALDIDLFRLVNEKLANPIFDVVMPFASGNGSLTIQYSADQVYGVPSMALLE